MDYGELPLRAVSERTELHIDGSRTRRLSLDPAVGAPNTLPGARAACTTRRARATTLVSR